MNYLDLQSQRLHQMEQDNCSVKTDRTSVCANACTVSYFIDFTTSVSKVKVIDFNIKTCCSFSCNFTISTPLCWNLEATSESTRILCGFSQSKSGITKTCVNTIIQSTFSFRITLFSVQFDHQM